MKNIYDAQDFARKKHAGQLDDEDKDYFETHLIPVQKAIQIFSDDVEVIMASVLHDTIEDTDTTYDELKNEFGKRVADLVMEVTHEIREDTGGHYFPRLKSKDAILIKLCDRASNISRMASWSEERQSHYLKKTIFSKQFPKFGRLEVISKVLDKKSHLMVMCGCDCGKKKSVRVDHLERGETKSCGCLQKERASASNTTHGLCNSTTYSTWANMKDRCKNIKNIGYKNYGGRGIEYDKRWELFSNFLEDMGEKPTNRSLDRVDNSKNYFKQNCRWATGKEQGNNKRNNRILEYKGEKKTMAQWAEEVGMNYHNFAQKLKHKNRVVDGVIQSAFWRGGEYGK